MDRPFTHGGRARWAGLWLQTSGRQEPVQLPLRVTLNNQTSSPPDRHVPPPPSHPRMSQFATLAFTATPQLPTQTSSTTWAGTQTSATKGSHGWLRRHGSGQVSSTTVSSSQSSSTSTLPSEIRRAFSLTTHRSIPDVQQGSLEFSSGQPIPSDYYPRLVFTQESEPEEEREQEPELELELEQEPQPEPVLPQLAPVEHAAPSQYTDDTVSQTWTSTTMSQLFSSVEASPTIIPLLMQPRMVYIRELLLEVVSNFMDESPADMKSILACSRACTA